MDYGKITPVGYGKKCGEYSSPAASLQLSQRRANNLKQHKEPFSLVTDEAGWQLCPACDGTGRQGKERCRRCNGQGRIAALK